MKMLVRIQSDRLSIRLTGKTIGPDPINRDSNSWWRTTWAASIKVMLGAFTSQNRGRYPGDLLDYVNVVM